MKIEVEAISHCIFSKLFSRTFILVILASFTCMLLRRPAGDFVNFLFRRSIGVMAESNPFKPGTFSIAYVTVPDETVANNLSRALVTNKIVACVNILPKIKSVYEWENKIEESDELLLIIKTRTNRVEDLINFVKKNHPYSVPEVITTPIENGNPAYLKWLGDIVKDVPSDKA